MIQRSLCLVWAVAVLASSCHGAPQAQSEAAGTRAAKTIYVSKASELQQALDEAQFGDTVELAAGQTYSGNFVFKAKSGTSTDFITVRSSAVDQLPAGRRVVPDWAPRMAKIITPNTDPAVLFAQNARQWRLIGLEITCAQGVYVFDIIRAGEMEATTAAVQPSNIELDRLYVHPHTEKGSKRGLFLNTNAFKLTNSHVSDFKSSIQDGMAVAVCNGPGPYDITNNFLEGAGYGIIFGGCPNGIPEVAPSDITFRRNHVYKPVAWQKEGWIVKNLFEVKMARRMRIEGNVFENNWLGGQSGFGILFTVRTDGKDRQGQAFGVIEDVTFTNNMMINMAQGINILGRDEFPGGFRGQTSKINIRNNLFVKVPGKLFQITQFAKDVVIEKNTAIGHDMIVASENEHTGFVMRDNIFSLGTYGIFGSGLGSGVRVLATNFPGSVVRFNGFVGEFGADAHPPGNTYVKDAAAARFVNMDQNDYRLQSNSPLRGKGQNNQDPGVDMDQLQAAINGVATIPTAPRIRAALNSVDGSTRVSPGGLMVLFGDSLANCVKQQETAPLPVTLCDTKVLMNLEPAPLLYVSPTQIVAQVPSSVLPGRNLPLRVITPGWESEEYVIQSPEVGTVSPAISTYLVRDSPIEWAFLRHEDGSWNGPLGSGAALRPNGKATLIVSGLGKTTPPIPDGYVPEPDSIPDSPVELYINDTFQTIESVKALLNSIGLFEVRFTLSELTSIGGLEDNWIWINTQGLESLRRRVQLSAEPLSAL
ncbi:MAG: right-handed parallel beta-helix repeat-containing protein [Bryobacterales bacterium]|nr:right-handed parallel beta-helix repeat-containing protein [Bryobacterales bacterium]